MATTAHPPQDSAGRQGLANQWVALAGMFCLVICVVMLSAHFRAGTDDPLKAPQLTALKGRLATQPNDQQLKERIRSLDLEVRRQYFRELWLNRSGAWLALAALGVFLLTGKRAIKPPQWLPTPPLSHNQQEQLARASKRARWAVGALAIVLLSGLSWLAMRGDSVLPPNAQAVEAVLNSKSPPAASVADFASPAEMLENWPRFRGPDGNGLARTTNAPVTWDVKAGRAVLWKSSVPVPGFNSPIVWGQRVFLSGGDAAKREVLCFDGDKGDLLWESPVQIPSLASTKPPQVPEQTGYAAASMATDGRRVYAIFANGDLAAFALDGREVWTKNLGTPKNPYGHASSLLTWQDRLLVQVDQGEAQQNLSKLYALDGVSGRMLWQVNRPVPASWATPIVIDVAGAAQVVTLGVPWVIAYAPKDGTELWRLEGLNNEVTPSPVFAGGLVLAVSPNEKLLAIRPNGAGNVTKTHLAWAAEDNIPDISSPVSNGELVFTLSTPGILTCYDSKDGQKVWEHDLGMECNASLTIAARRLYVAGLKGTVVVVEAGREFKELARNARGENIYASPAFVRGRAFFRGATNLFCIGPEATLAKTE